MQKICTIEVYEESPNSFLSITHSREWRCVLSCRVLLLFTFSVKVCLHRSCSDRKTRQHTHTLQTIYEKLKSRSKNRASWLYGCQLMCCCASTLESHQAELQTHESKSAFLTRRGLTILLTRNVKSAEGHGKVEGIRVALRRFAGDAEANIAHLWGEKLWILLEKFSISSSPPSTHQRGKHTHRNIQHKRRKGTGWGLMRATRLSGAGMHGCVRVVYIEDSVCF